MIALSVFTPRYLKMNICNSLLIFGIAELGCLIIFSGLDCSEVLGHRNTLECVLSNTVALFFTFLLIS